MEEKFPLPSAVEPKLLVYQNVALRRQLEAKRSEIESLRRDISDHRNRLTAAELLAMVAIDQSHISENDISHRIRSLAPSLTVNEGALESEISQIFRSDISDSLWKSRCVQMNSEIISLKNNLEISSLEIQRLSFLRPSSSLSLAFSSGVTSGATHGTHGTHGTTHGTTTHGTASISGVGGGGDYEIKYKEELTNSKLKQATLRSEILWRRSEGYESLLGSLKFVHEDRNLWRAKFSEVEDELREFRRETSESLEAVERDFAEMIGNFRNEISGLQTAVLQAETERETATGVAETASGKLETAQTELESLTPLIGNLKMELEICRQELAVTSERCEKLQSEADALGGALTEISGEGEWQKKYRELRTKFEVEIDYRNKLKEANIRLKTKLTEEKDVWRQVERLNEVLRQKDEAHNKLMTLHMQMQQQLRQFREREEAVNQRSINIEATLSRMHAEISALHAQVQSCEVAAKEKEVEVQVVRVEKENLVRQLGASQQSNSQLENALAKVKSVVNELEQDLKDAMTKNSDLNRQLQRLQRRTVAEVPPDMLQLQLAEFRTMVKCSLCNDNFKDVMLTKCAHCFCRSCVNDNLLNARNRKCPLCGTRFAESDVKPVHLTQ